MFKKFSLYSLFIPLSLPVMAGSLDAPAGGPSSPSGAMYNIQDICNRLDTGTDGTQNTFTEPTSGPGSTGCSLNDVMSKSPVKDNTNGAQPSDVVVDKTYWGLIDGNWGIKTGTSTLAPMAKSGQTTSSRAGDDGTHQKGVTVSGLRFTDNGNGTVTDNLTSLIWTKDANCPSSTKIWDDAIDYSNVLASGTCGLSDGSVIGDWRLPNVRELQSLVDYSQYSPGLPSGHPFLNVQSDYYWSSTTFKNNTGSAWAISMNTDVVFTKNKTTNFYYVWLVRD
ncbi:Protein of unknown function DUF1566 [Beggiatoa sp. PS]|nr:Protein of unknown function DUF1566 [Beggiatoa sp. PS]